jgi:hypothetical protein
MRDDGVKIPARLEINNIAPEHRANRNGADEGCLPPPKIPQAFHANLVATFAAS